MTRPARSLVTLLGQVNDIAPTRSTLSDGGLASNEHHKQNPDSDHEQDADGVYHARDFTHDPPVFDAYAFADVLLEAQDPRLKYVISNRRIGSGPAGPRPGVWRPYRGVNAHAHHTHVSVMPGGLGDQAQPWVIGPMPTAHLSTLPPLEEDTDMKLVHDPEADVLWLVDPRGTKTHVAAVNLDLLKADVVVKTATQRAALAKYREVKP